MVEFNFHTSLFSMILLNILSILISKIQAIWIRFLDHCLPSPHPDLPRFITAYPFDTQYNSWVKTINNIL